MFYLVFKTFMSVRICAKCGPLDTDRVVVRFNDGPVTSRYRIGPFHAYGPEKKGKVARGWAEYVHTVLLNVLGIPNKKTERTGEGHAAARHGDW